MTPVSPCATRGAIGPGRVHGPADTASKETTFTR
jgi:hypothetical protein